MKRVLSALFALLMLPLMGWAADEQANQNIPAMMQSGMAQYIYTAAAADNTVYLYLADGLYTWQPGQEGLKQAVAQDRLPNAQGKDSVHLNTLLSDDQQLWGLDEGQGLLFTVDVLQGEMLFDTPIPLQMDDFKHTQESPSGDTYSYTSTPEQCVLAEGKLFALYGDTENNTQNRTLVSFDMESGKITTYQSEHILGITPYKDGKLLAAVRDQDNAYNMETGSYIPAALFVFDPEKDTLEEIGTFAGASFAQDSSPASLYYEKDKDAVLYFLPNTIMRRFADGTEEKCAYLPVRQSYGRMGAVIMPLGAGRIAIVQENMLYVRSTNPEDLPSTTLVVYGASDNAAHRQALLDMPDAAVTVLEDRWFSTAQELAQALVSGEEGIDVLLLDSAQMDVRSLAAKGYAADVSQSAILKTHMENMYPVLREAGIQEGKIFALPVSSNLTSLAVHAKAFKALGIPLPQTFDDVCQVVNTWYQGAMGEGEYNLINQIGVDWVQEMLLHAYNDAYAFSGQDVLLDTPLFRRMMASLQALPLEKIQEDYGSVEAQDIEGFYEKTCLFYLGHTFSLHNYGYGEYNQMGRTMPDSFYGLKASEDSPAVIRADVKYLLINSQSKNLEAALRYAENYVKALDAATRIVLYPGENEPVVAQNYEENLFRLRKSLENVQEALKTAEGAEKTNLETYVKNWQERIAEHERYNKYEVKAEAIAAYRKLMEDVYVITPDNSLLLQQMDLVSLRSRFNDGQITLEQYIQQVDAKLRLIRLENQ